jgi:hypothetical protein
MMMIPNREGRERPIANWVLELTKPDVFLGNNSLGSGQIHYKQSVLLAGCCSVLGSDGNGIFYSMAAGLLAFVSDKKK